MCRWLKTPQLLTIVFSRGRFRGREVWGLWRSPRLERFRSLLAEQAAARPPHHGANPWKLMENDRYRYKNSGGETPEFIYIYIIYILRYIYIVYLEIMSLIFLESIGMAYKMWYVSNFAPKHSVKTMIHWSLRFPVPMYLRPTACEDYRGVVVHVPNMRTVVCQKSERRQQSTVPQKCYPLVI